jgi:ATP-binding cassette subfamily C protein LapB
MDTQTEAAFIADLAQATHGQTLVVVTHRPSLLQLVDRVIVVDAGKIAADGPKEAVLAALRAPASAAAQPAAQTQSAQSAQSAQAPQPHQPSRPSVEATENAQ